MSLWVVVQQDVSSPVDFRNTFLTRKSSLSKQALAISTTTASSSSKNGYHFSEVISITTMEPQNSPMVNSQSVNILSITSKLTVNSRKLTYQTFPCQSPRRLLFSQHTHLLPSLRIRLSNMGIPRMQRVVFQDYDPTHR